jgi:periplasmic copper chaperone A
MRRLILQFAAASTLTAVSIGTAFAHASLERSEAAPGSYKAVLKIPHGCEGKATNLVRVDIPEGFIGVKPMPKPGWTLETKKGDYAKKYDLHGEAVTSGVQSVTWSGGSLPDEFYDEFVLSGMLAGVGEGQKLFFKTLQQCAGAEVAWNEEPAEGQDPHSLEYPAPSLTILAAGNGAHGHGAHGAPSASDAVTAGDLTITGAWARAMLPGQPAGGGYLTIANKGQVADKLVSASSPVAGKAEIHTMEVVNNVMVMRPVRGGLDVPAGATVELKPGGLHVMFMAVKEPFKEGGSVSVTLEFEKAGKVEVMLPVQAKQGLDEHADHGG